MGKLIDLTGQKFGRLTVLERVEDQYAQGGSPKVMWKCICECGNEIVTHSQNLRRGHTKSCGCYNIEKTRERMSIIHHKPNKYDLTGTYGIGWTNNTNEEFYFDLEDYDKIKNYGWYVHHTGYLMATTRKIDGEKKHIFFHKIIFDDGYNYVVDHVGHNKLDCRKSMLRKTTQQNNNKNKSLVKNNTSGVHGVVWHKRDCVWEVWIGHDNKKHYVGRYFDYNKAVAARKQMEEKYYGNFSYDNSMKMATDNEELYER